MDSPYTRTVSWLFGFTFIAAGFLGFTPNGLVAYNGIFAVNAVHNLVIQGSIVHTDGSAAYRSLNNQGYSRHKIVHLGSSDPAHVTMPGVYRIASLLKRWLLGTHQGSVRSYQLDYYLDEYTFRFNRRTSRSRGLLFYRLLEQAMATGPITYQGIVAKNVEHNM